MNHPELDELLGLVRGEEVAVDVRAHVDGCAECAADLASVVRLDTAADAIGPALVPGRLTAPPSSVWEQVQAELATDAPIVLAGPAAASSPRRPSRAVTAAAAAVVGIVIGGVGGYLLADDDASSPNRPVAAGTLAPEGERGVSAEVALTQDDSARSLTVTFSEVVPGPGYVEAWLLDPETNEMLGLGVLSPEGGTVTVPPDADLSRFTTVDISREPFDGDPAHSTDSIARGTLDQA